MAVEQIVNLRYVEETMRRILIPLILLNLFLVSCAAREVKPVVSPTVAPNTAVPSATPQLAVTADSATNVAVTEPASPFENEALGQLYFFTLPHQSGQFPQMVRLPGSCVVGLSACPQLESLPAPFPFSFNLSPLAWSPDGALAAFAYSDNVNGTPTKLWTFDPSSDKWISLAQFPFIDPPFWSPDGAWIAFRAQDGVGGEDAVVVRRDGTQLKKLSLPVAGRPYMMDGWLMGEIILRSALPGKEGTLYLMNAADGTTRPLPTSLPIKSTLFPSHTGGLLAFDDTDSTGQKQVLKLTQPDAASPAVELATFSGGFIHPVVWSPDDSRIAFVYYTPAASAEVYWVDRDGRNLTQIYKGAAVGRVIFSPDGKFLLVEETTSPTGGHLFAINLETLERKILSAPGLSLDTDWYAPSWRP
jgi:Tol biopolymer transport system component